MNTTCGRSWMNQLQWGMDTLELGAPIQSQCHCERKCSVRIFHICTCFNRYNKQICIEDREYKVEYIFIDLLDLSHLYYDISARSTVSIILQQTSCIYCLHFTLAIVVGLPSPINFKQRH